MSVVEHHLHEFLRKRNQPATDDIEQEKIDSYLTGIIVGLALGWVTTMFVLVCW